MRKSELSGAEAIAPGSPGRAPAGANGDGYAVAAAHRAGRFGRLEIRPEEHAVLADGRPLALTVRELALLSELARNPERIMTREELYQAVWGRALRPSDRSVDVYVSRLRAKLAEAIPGTRFIHTHFGIGYRFAPEP